MISMKKLLASAGFSSKPRIRKNCGPGISNISASNVTNMALLILSGAKLTNLTRRDELFGHPFPRNTRYFDPGTQPFMINYLVANLDTLLNELSNSGIEVDPRVE